MKITDIDNPDIKNPGSYQASVASQKTQPTQLTSKLQSFNAEPKQCEMPSYHGYDLTTDTLTSFMVTLEYENRSAHKMEDLQKTSWGKMYSAACETFKGNLNCSSCEQGPCGATSPDAPKSTGYSERRRIMVLARKQDAKTITERTLKEAEEDFIYFEDKFLD
jgi:hypothetical protein